MARTMTADTLRKVADALDRMTATTAETGVDLCAYGTTHIEIEGTPLRLETVTTDNGTQYVLDLTE